MRPIAAGIEVVTLLALLLGGCNAPLEDAWPATLEEVDEVRNDDSLSAQQKRDALAALGFPASVVNALLQGERLGNQYGGDLRSAYEKVAGDHLDELTPDEVQIYGDEASAVDTALDFAFTDEEARAIVDFFQAEGIAARDELVLFLDDPFRVAALSSDIPDGALNDLFADFDPDSLLERLP